MERVPRRASTDKRSSGMTDNISSAELGKLRCSNLDVPLLTSEIFEPVLTVFLTSVTDEQWMLLAQGQIDEDTIVLLSDMCYEILDVLSVLILEVVAPQVQSRVNCQTPRESDSDSSSTSVTMDWKRNVTEEDDRVTEEDIQASIGNSFHRCFGATLDVPQERSADSEKLVELFAAEVKKRVNRSLAVIRCNRSTSSESETSSASHTEDMVYYVIQILSWCFSRKDSFELPNDEGSLNGDSYEGSSADEVTYVEEFIPEEPVMPEMTCSLSDREGSVISGSLSVQRSVSSSAEEPPQQKKTFLAVFLGKLLDHICHSTKTSICDVDFDGMLERLGEKTVGELNSNLPQTVGDFHISIYEELCREFGSAKLLLAAMVSGDVAFEDAVARTLRGRLPKSSKKTVRFATKVRTILAKTTSKVSPDCETATSSSHSEVIDLESGSTAPLTRKRKRPAFARIISFVARRMRKRFTCCSDHASPV